MFKRDFSVFISYCKIGRRSRWFREAMEGGEEKTKYVDDKIFAFIGQIFL